MTTAIEVINRAKLNWNVKEVALFADEGTNQQPVSTHKQIVRTDTGEQLGIVGSGYTVVQNSEAFSWFDNLVQSGNAQYVGAGEFGGGRSVWIRAQVEKSEVAKGDIVSWELLLTNAHDGSAACRARVAPIRLVCTNGLTAVSTQDQTMVSIRHTRNAVTALHQAKEVLASAQKQIAMTRSVYEALAKAQVGAAQVKRVIEAVFPQQKKQEIVHGLFDGEGVGLNIPSVRGSAWALYNAVTEAVDHHLTDTSDADRYLEKILVGTGAQPSIEDHKIRVAQARVYYAQHCLGVSVDGIWGTKSTSACLTFQQEHQIPQTGLPDEETILKLTPRHNPA